MRVSPLHLALVLCSTAQAAPPAPGSADALIMQDFQEWIRTQHADSGQWCCDLGDGRPLNDTEVRVTGDHYQIFYSRQHWSEGTDQWIDVPPGVVLRQFSPVGYVIAWVINGRVFCLALVGAS